MGGTTANFTAQTRLLRELLKGNVRSKTGRRIAEATVVAWEVCGAIRPLDGITESFRSKAIRYAKREPDAVIAIGAAQLGVQEQRDALRALVRQ